MSSYAVLRMTQRWEDEQWTILAWLARWSCRSWTLVHVPEIPGSSRIVLAGTARPEAL